MNHYSTLGVDRSASPEEIKAAFKKLAMKHHPDRGGDAKTFQEINEAYSVLSDPEKRMMYDHGGNRQHHFTTHGGGPFQEFNFSFGGDGFQNPFVPDPHFEDMMRNFGFGFARQPQRNKDLNLRYKISLKDSYLGKKVQIDYRLLNGENQSINVDIPPGIEHGQMIKMGGYGDNGIKNIPRGDLTIAIEIEPVSNFRREDLNLITETEITIFDAMIGCKKIVKNIDDSDVEIFIRPGTQHGQRYSCRGLGFASVKFSNVRGDLHVIVNVKTPVVTDQKLISEINELAKKIK